MLRGNLSARPFYNERVVHVALGLVSLVLGVLTIVSLWQFASLTRQQNELSRRIAADEARTATLVREAQEVQRGIDPTRLEATVRATREANTVIDERTFSWTALFNVIERTIPEDVSVRAVSPNVDRGDLFVTLVLNARRVEPVGQFMDRLEQAGAFADLRSIEEQLQEDGSYNVVCEGRYLGQAAIVEPATPAAASGPAAGG